MESNKIKKNIYNYRVYGLYIESDIELNELVKTEKVNKEEKVTISKKLIDNNIKLEICTGKNININFNDIWFNISKVGIFQIINGKTVYYELYNNPDMNLVRVYLTCSCLGFIMLQRKKIALHGGTVVINNNGYIISGERGAGKSTLTTALRLSGCKFISDDVSSLSIENGICVNFGFPYQKLCEDVMDKFDYNKNNYISYREDTKRKYLVPALNDFIADNVPLKAIFMLERNESIGEVNIEEIKGFNKLKNIINIIYRGEFLNKLPEIYNECFKECLCIAKNIKFYRIKRPSNDFSVQEQINLINKNI